MLSRNLVNTKEVLIFKFKFKINFPSLSKNDLQELNKIILKNDVILVLDAEKSPRSMIYWKEKTFNDILSLKPYYDDHKAENPMLYQFIVKFLVHCLSIGQSGMNKLCNV